MVVPIYKAKITLSRLVKRAAAGETILIGGGSHPIVKLVGIDNGASKKIIFGAMKGQLEVLDDFDAPLPNALLDDFEGR